MELNMRQRLGTSIAAALLLFSAGSRVSAQTNLLEPVQLGVKAGLGLPKVPFSIYYPPLSLSGGVTSRFRLSRRFSAALDAAALYTINFGTVTGKKRDLTFNLYWAGVTAMYALQHSLFEEQFFAAGFNRYFLEREIDNERLSISSPGISIGLYRVLHTETHSSSLDISWHLLFGSDPGAQFLLISFAWFF